MKKILFLLLTLGVIGCNRTPKPAPQPDYTPELLLSLPEQYNTPDGATLGKDGNLYVSINNFNDGYLLENKIIESPNPPSVLVIDPNNNFEEFYRFTPQDLHPKTGFIGPMDLAFGPDGNLYVADMQIAFDPMHQSRLVRINIENGRAVSMDVLVEGFIASNGMVWSGNTLYVTESILQHFPPGQQEGVLTSGVYAFDINELNNLKTPIQLSPYHTAPDPHLAITFQRSSLGFGADGIDVDDAGNLYTTVSGAVYKTVVGVDGKEIHTELFAEDPNAFQSFDGIVWHQRTRKFYTVGFFENALYSIDENGHIETLHQNGDTDGSGGLLDQPAEPVFRGDELVIVNMDLGSYAPDDVNTKPDAPYTLSRVDLSAEKTKSAPTTDRSLHEDVFSMLVKIKVTQPQLREEFEQALEWDVAGAHTEKGNIAMELYQDKTDPNTYLIYEIWENRAALYHHFTEPWTQAAFAAGAKAQAQTEFIYLRDLDPLPEGQRKHPSDTNMEVDDLIVFFEVKPEERDRFVKQFRDLTVRSRKEKGTLAFHLYEVVDKPNHFVLYERWTSEAVHLEHIQRDYVQALFAMFDEALVNGFTLGQYPGLYNAVEIAPKNRRG